MSVDLSAQWNTDRSKFFWPLWLDMASESDQIPIERGYIDERLIHTVHNLEQGKGFIGKFPPFQKR